MAIAEYNPISISLKNIMFNTTITVSIIIIILLILKSGLKLLAIKLSKSDPPVDELLFRRIAVPSPITIPPYMQARNLSFVSGVNLSNMSMNIEKLMVPNNDFRQKANHGLARDGH